MGKKSRKKVGKKEHQERMKARAEKREEQLIQAEEEYEADQDNLPMYGGKPREFIDGDYVRYYEGKNGSVRRGVISDYFKDGKKIEDYFTFKAYDSDVSECVSVNDIYTDIGGMVLRFQVGMKVRCRSEETHNQWIPCIIKELWPKPDEGVSNRSVEENAYPMYLCQSYFVEDYQMMIYNDTYDYIREIPGPTRLQIGDQVVFNSALAESIKNSHRHFNGGWMNGKIVKINPRDELWMKNKRSSTYVGRYKCSFRHREKVHNCYILEDNDEYISQSDPRTRLFDAIEQGCSYDHICYLVDEFGIDVSIFQDLFISKTLEHASYDALWWAQEHLSIPDLSKIQEWFEDEDDVDADFMRQKLGESPNVLRFMQKAVEVELDNRCNERWDSEEKKGLEDVIALFGRYTRGDKMPPFLQGIIMSGNILALDFALSSIGLGSVYSFSCKSIGEDSKNMTNFIKDYVDGKDGMKMKFIAEKFSTFMFQCSSDFRPNSLKKKKEKKDYHSSLRMLVKLHLRFEWDFLVRNMAFVDRHQYKYGNRVKREILCLARDGEYEVFRAIIEEDENFLHYELESLDVCRGQDNGEFVQEELRDKNVTVETGFYKRRQRERMGLVDLLVIGRFKDDYFKRGDFCHYDRVLARFLHTSDNIADEWVACMKAEVTRLSQKENYSSHSSPAKTFSMRIKQFEDDETLEGRVQILEYLTTEKQFKPPSPIVTIFSRQCGILRWLKVRGYLTDKQFCLQDLKEYLSYFGQREWLVDLRLDEATTLQQYYFCLCIATVHYDDFQSLVWLIREFGVKKLQLDKERPLNILHLAAYFGRKEIIYYLRTLDTWQLWLNQPVKRGKFKGMYAAHVAVSEGHLDLVKLMINDGCPQVDVNKKSMHDYASQSNYDFVVEWGMQEEIEREEHKLLDADASRFLQMLQSSDVDTVSLKAFFMQSKCLDPMSWLACDHLDKFREYVAYFYEAATFEFSIWFCTRIFLEVRNTINIPKITGRLGIDDNDDQMNNWINSDWVNEERISCDNHIECADGLHDPLQILSCVQSSELKSKVGHSLMQIERLSCIDIQIRAEFKRLITTCNSANKLSAFTETMFQIFDRLQRDDHTSSPFSYGPITVDKRINLDYDFLLEKTFYKDGKKYESLLNEAFLGSSFELGEWMPMYQILIFFSDISTLRYCLLHNDGLNSAIELRMIYLATVINRRDIFDMFLESDSDLKFTLPLRDRLWVVTLCAAERGDYQDMKLYLRDNYHLPDPLLTHFDEILEHPERFRGIDFDALQNLDSLDILLSESDAKSHIASLSLFLVNGFLNRSSSESNSKSVTTAFLHVARSYKYESRHLLLAAYCCLDRAKYYHKLQRLLRGFTNLIKSLPNDNFGKVEIRIIKKVCISLLSCLSLDDDQRIAIRQCLELAITFGVDVVHGKEFEKDSHRFNRIVTSVLKEFKDRQRIMSKRFDGIKTGSALSKVKDDLQAGRIDLNAVDEGGMFLVHIASAYDRVDILDFLYEELDLRCLKKLDKQGRTALEIAESAKAVNAITWIKKHLAAEVISGFVKSRYHVWKAQKFLKTCLHGFKTLQALFRGRKVRREIKTRLIMNIESSHRFQMIWAQCIQLFLILRYKEKQTWNSIRVNLVDFAQAFDFDDNDQDDLADTMERLDIATAVALDTEEVLDLKSITCNEGEETTSYTGDEQIVIPSESDNTKSCINIQYTSHVAKWLKQGDRKYRDFFVRRITQLSKGERSRILAKRLTGSKMTIFETYLEQKSGFRILWTEEGDNILVWYVAKHDQVSRLMSRIDASQSRSERQLVSAKTLLEENTACEEESASNMERIVLDPLSNVPLKVYEIPVHEIATIAEEDWAPNLRLTDEERAVVETKGTVLLLGRSGTGKTVCICNRIDYDRRQNSLDSSFTQLFISRSQKLCKYVSETIGTSDNTTFSTFDDLLSTLSNQLPKVTNIRDTYHNFNYMSFDRFKAEVHSGGKGSIDPLLVWTCIKSYIKGSIEAVIKNVTQKALGKDEFLSLGSKRCRLTQEQRLEVYSIYERYEQYMSESHLWDDCDRIVSLLERLEVCKNTNRDQYESLRYSKIYIDEVQDYTQAEILLFFYLSGPGDLFLAGDSAQSVVEGVEFRFEDIRSVEYYVAPEKHNLMLQKPMVVNVNFRSHTGVLNIAASILSYMFEAFPNSAKQLKEDRGIFQGPRPSVLYRLDYKRLSSLFEKSLNGAIVLVNDSHVSRYRRLLNDYPLVYGIRAAKGLEFKSVIILDFFGDLRSDLQKPWRELLLGRAQEDFRECFPEVEGQLKLLYTGVTRCIDRLFFIETSGSIAGDACVRWLTTTSIQRQKKHTLSLATLDNKIGEIEGVAMTKDDWISSGIENAEAAEDCQKANLASAESLLEKAVYCFQQAGEEYLARKARAHRDSIQFKSRLPSQNLVTQNAMTESNEMEESLFAMEDEAAAIVEHLMRENLFMEAEDVCCCIMPYLPEYTKKKLQVQIINKLRSFG